jgi:hypothetical protein
MARDILNNLVEDSYNLIKESLNVLKDSDITAHGELLIARLDRASKKLKDALDIIEDDSAHGIKIPRKEIEIAD